MPPEAQTKFQMAERIDWKVSATNMTTSISCYTFYANIIFGNEEHVGSRGLTLLQTN